MKIEIKTYDLTVTVEHKNDDLTIEDYFEHLEKEINSLE
jgi:hypothetical protein